jgi:hypothetical protein
MRQFTTAFLVCGLFFASLARAEHTRITNPSALNLEVLGRGLLYSVSFDRVMNDELAAGIGIGSTSLVGSGTATMIPVYVNYYFQKDQGSLYATGGATLVAGDDISDSKSSFGSVELNNVVPTFGVGYENRGDSGFLFRVTGYGIVAEKLTPWVGFTFGYAF